MRNKTVANCLIGSWVFAIVIDMLQSSMSADSYSSLFGFATILVIVFTVWGLVNLYKTPNA